MLSQDQVLEELNAIFREVFNNTSIVVRPETTASDIKEWDSLNHMRLITEIEERFSCEFEFDEVMNFKNVGDVIITIQNKKA